MLSLAKSADYKSTLAIAGDLAVADFQFLSSRKTAWAERCQPKTPAAALDGSLKL